MRSVWIAGSVNMDVVATAARHPQIGETVVGREVFFFPGGKGANQAVAAAKLGAPTALIGKVGDDAFGRELRQFLAAQNVGLKFLRDTAEARTGTAVITVADADNSIVVIPGANALLSERDVAEPALATGDVAVSQFEIPLPTVTAFFSRARSAGATTILNLAPAAAFDRGLLDLVDILVLNETELSAIAGTEIGESASDAHIVEAGASGLLWRGRDGPGSPWPGCLRGPRTLRSRPCRSGAPPAAVPRAHRDRPPARSEHGHTCRAAATASDWETRRAASPDPCRDRPWCRRTATCHRGHRPHRRRG